MIEVNKLRKSEDQMVRQAWEVPVKGERSRGRQPRRWSSCLWKRLGELGLKKEDAQDCKKGEVESRSLTP